MSSVPRAEFGSEPLRVNLNDIEWLESVARTHESVLDAALQLSTIVPLRMCTLYEHEESVREMLERERASLAGTLERLENRWEWAVKVLVDQDRLLSAAQLDDEPLGGLERDLEGQGEGGAYLRRRRLERDVRESAGALATDVARQVHARLQDWALDAVTHPAQNRELSGHEGEMLLNAAYLVERDRADELRGLVAELRAHNAELGVRIELTGPWPPYNFVGAESPAATA